MVKKGKPYHIVECEKLIDGSGNTPVDNVYLIIEDGFIVSIEEKLQERYLSGSSSRINSRGCTVLPGLVDGHVHLCATGSFDPVAQMKLRESAPLTTLKAYQRAMLTLEAGFTTLRDAACKEYIGIAVRDAIKSGIIAGPDIVATGKGLTVTGGHRDTYLAPDVTIGQDVEVINSPEEAVKAARQQFRSGADMLKVVASGTSFPGQSDFNPQMTVAEMKAAIFEAKRKVIPRMVGAHAVGEAGVANAIEAGVDIIDHGIFLDDQTFQQMKAKNIALVPTLSVYYGLASKGFPGAQEIWDKSQASFIKALKNNIRIMMGTDAGAPDVYHGNNALELKLMVDLGLSEMEAIISATRTSAEVLNLKDRGTLEVGKRADLLIVRGNPLENIGLLNELQNIVLVMKAGDVLISKDESMISF